MAAGRQPGTKKTGGRKKGTPNKNTQLVRKRLEELGFDPIEGMIVIHNEARQEGDLSTAGQMCKELAQYAYPKLKAIEVSGVNGDAIKTDNKWTIEVVKADDAQSTDS
jgi:hypothetical protein